MALEDAAALNRNSNRVVERGYGSGPPLARSSKTHELGHGPALPRRAIDIF